jgi:hypothetical protein
MIDLLQRSVFVDLHASTRKEQEMRLKKIGLYRGFNVFTEEIRGGIWGFSVIEVPASEEAGIARTPHRGRVPGEYDSMKAALEAARAHIDRIHKNRLNRANQAGG